MNWAGQVNQQIGPEFDLSWPSHWSCSLQTTARGRVADVRALVPDACFLFIIPKYH